MGCLKSLIGRNGGKQEGSWKTVGGGVGVQGRGWGLAGVRKWD